MTRIITRGAIAALWLFVAAPTLGHAATSDAWITTKAKMSLLTTEGVSGTSINVDTIDGRVTLHGKASSNEEKAKAENAVKSIDGVREVRNLLQVVAPGRENAVKRSDADVKRAVEQTLARDHALKNSSISVQSVNDGVVLLAGKAQTMSDHLRAVEDASRVPGVRRVATEIQSPDKLADAEIWRGERGKTEHDRGVADSASDYRITAATKLKLIADSSTPALDINVDTREGVVTLFGMVPTAAAKRAAEADARTVSGVKHVVNELQVVAKAEQKNVATKDSEVKDHIQHSIASHENLKDVNVDVKGGVVRLTGTVPTEEDRLKAAVEARKAAGVRAVHDELRIRAGEGRTSG